MLVNTKFLIRNSADKYIKASYPGSGTLYHYSGYTNSTSDATAFTLKNVNKNFYFDVDKLPAGTYTVIEQDTSTTGFTAKGSKSVKVTVTANNSGGIKTAQFENQPSQLVINKTFRKYGAVTDDDYKDVTVEIAKNNSSSPIKAVCIDTENNVYQYVSVSNDSVYSGKTITDQLVFYNPKVHNITVIGLPAKSSNGTFYQYTAKEKDTGRTSGRNIAKRYIYNNVSKTFQTGVTQSDTLTNTERSIGYIEIEKDFEIENTDGSRSEFTGNDKLILTEAYSDISFLVKNAAGKYLKANFIGNQYMYSSLVNTSAEATKFSFYAGNKTKIRIINLPFGTYHVTEVIGSKVKGQGFRAESSGQKSTVTYYNVSADEVVGGHTKFVNVKPQYVGLRIYKTFTDTDGESVDVSQKIYRQLSFSLSDENGSRIPVVLDNSVQGTYHPFKLGNGETPRETMQLGTSTHTITITGLESGKTYLVRERIAGTELKKICVCKSSFTVEGTKENKAVFADEDAVVLGNTVTMPSGEHSTAEVYFENTYKTTEITINKESDDDLVERRFAVTTLNYSLYPADSPLYVTTEKQTVNGKVNGVATVKDLPLAYYDEETDSIIKIQYQIEEVDTPQYYEIPEKQVIIPMDGQKSVTIKNKLKQGKIKVIKKAEVNGSDEIIPLSGVGFELSNDYNSTVLKGETNENGEILFENLPVAVGVKDEDGKEIIKKIRYTAHEVAGIKNEKYVLANDKTTTLRYTAEEAKIIKTLTFTNTPITGNIYLEKADARTKEALSGAEFTVYNDTNGDGKYDKNDTLATGYILSENNGQTVYTPYNTLVEVMETTEDEDGQPVTKGTGRYELYNLEKGKYIVVETKTPVGYVIEQKEFAFEIKEDGQIVHVYEKDGKPVIGDSSETVDSDEDQFVYNTPIFGDIYLHKIDESNKQRLSGAVFDVWKDDGSGKLNTKKDELCGTMTELKGSDGKGTGEYEMKDLPYGTYFVTEVKAPEGYMRSKKTYTVEVRQNGQRVFIDDVENPQIKGNVSVVKIDAYTKEQLADAEFTVYSDVNKDGMITKDTDMVYGKLVYHADTMTYSLNDLPYGEYVLTETKAPAGHVLTEKVYPFRIIDNSVTVEVNDDGEIGIPNDPIEGYIKVIKKDKKADIPVEGAEFTLYDSKGKVVKKVTTDKEGTANFGKQVYGKYTVKETTAPKHYVLDDTPIPFEILEHGKTYTFTQKETPKPGYGSLKKTSEDGVLEGFKFHIYGKSDSGVSYDETHTTDKNGEINIELLPGNYTVEEVRTPSRYIQPESKKIRVEVDETTKVSFENKLKKGGIIIRKFDKKHPDMTVSGAVFTVYQNGKEYKKLTETSNGVYELKNIPYGDYTVKETSAPEGYLLDTGTYDFSIRNDSEIITISNSDKDKFVEAMIEGSVELIKKDSKTHKPLENAEFTIYKVVGEKTEFYKALRTDKNGKLTFTEVPYGNYVIKETKAPEGYNIDTGEYPFSIKENGQVFKLVNNPEGDFIETQIEGTVMLIKKDSENNEPIEGAEFTLYDSDKKVFRVGYTDAEGKLSFAEVPYGEYTIKETKAPAQYLIDTDSYPLNIKTHQQVITISNSTDGTFRENPIKGSIELYKVDKNTRKPLAGAEFTLFDDKGTAIQKITTDKNGKAVFSEVRYGKYTVRETKAPAKYAVISDAIPFEVLEHGKVYEFNVEDPEIPGYGYLKKTSEDGVLEGFKFHIYGISDSGNKVDQTLTTNDKGEIKINLFEGTYTVEEVDAPDRYLSTAKQTVKIISDKTTEIKFDNKLKKGNIEILKLDGTTRKPLAGAEFTLYNAKGDIVQKVTSNEEGKAVFSDLPYGEYNVVETKAPAEYEADSIPIPFSIVENGKTLYHTKENTPVPGHGYLKKTSEDGAVEGFKFHVYGTSDTGVKFDKTIVTDKNGEFNIELLKGTYTVEEIEVPDRYIKAKAQTVKIESGKTTEISFVNRLIKGNIEILKIDDTTQKPLAGAEFTLNDAKGNAVQVLTTGADGTVTFKEVPYGKYTVVETKVPDKYEADSTPIPFEILENGKTLRVTKTNTPVPGHGYLKKISEDGVKAGFKFKVTGTSDTGVSFEDTVITDENGEFNLELLEGTYEVEEIETPVRYLVPGKQTIKIESGKTKSINFENRLKKGSIEVLKIDKKANIPLSGAEFTLYNSNGESVKVLTTGADGKVTFTDVPYGDYTVIETKAPDEYTADSTPIPFSIVEHGKTLYYTKTNTPVPGHGYLKKTSEDGIVEGFKFHVYGISDTGVKYDNTISTDANGEFNIELLEGTYTVEEIEVPDRYIKAKAQTIKIESGKTTKISFVNKLIKGNIEILKIDDTTQKPLSGAEFTLNDAKGNAVQVLTTGTDGKVTFKEVPYGKYTVIETKAPDKYTADSKPIPFSIVKNGKTLYHTKENTPVPGHGYLKKTSEDGIVEGFNFHVYGISDTGVKYDNTISTDTNGEFNIELLEGTYTVEEIEVPDKYIQPDKQTVRIRSGKTTTIRFENSPKKSNIAIVKKDSKNNKPIRDAEFTLYNSDGETVITLDTDADGKLTFADIPYGNYTVKETKAPKGYIRDKKTYPVTVRNDGETLVVSNRSDGTFREKPIEGTIEIIKIDEKTSKPLVGAEFTLYNAKGKVVQVVVTGNDGKAIFADVRYGSYTVVETKAPDKYTADPTPIPFSIVKEGLLIAYEMDNTPIPGVGYLKKTSEDGIAEGFKFHVYGTSDTGVAFDETITTDENGELNIDLLEGEYTIEEVETPDRYIQPDKQSIRIESGKTTSVEFDNRLKKGNIEIIKIDEITRKPLAGAEFTLFDADDNAVLVLTTDENGKVSFENVPYGDYHVAETKAPEDYVLDSTPIPFSVIEDGMLIALEKENTPDSGSVEIVKESEDGVIENVGFHIYGIAKNGVEINETVYTDKEGKFLIENLLVGTYTIEEIEMPDRYIAQEPKTVEVIANEKAVVTFENILKKGSVTTTKVDAEYPDHKLSGAVFEIFDADYNSVGFMEEIETGIYRLDNLVYGKYILKEIEAPEYYELDTNEYPFEITENGDVRNIETLAGVGFINNAQRGSLVITKRSSDNKLEGFSFRITGKAFTGQEYDEVFKTDADGKITVEGLRVGNYTVSEISDETNVRYILPDDKEITIPANNTAEIEMFNDEKTIPFEITKKDISTGELIPDCAFRIRNSDGEIVIEGRTDKDGIAKFELVCGDYTYQEFDAPEGFIIDTKEYTFTINPDDTIVKAEMTNIGTGTIEITKKDISTGELIPDCGIEILDENKKIIFQGRTDSDGVVTFGKLPYGKYYYREFDAPEGYVLDETPYPFEIKKNGEIVKATMTNKPVEKEPGYITTDKPKEPGEVTVPTGDMTDFIVIMLVLTAGLSLALIVFNIRASRKRNNKN